MDIAAHIGKLVLEHECVIIPGLGGFLTNYHAAEINRQYHLIQPPSRKLVFNAQLNSNDGFLAHYLSQRLDISFKSSLLLLEVFSKYCQRDLAEGKQIAFGDLGILDRNNHNKLEFYPNTTNNYNEDAFGLKAVAIKSIVRKPDYSLIAPIQNSKVEKPHTKVINLNGAVLRKIAAVLLPLALLIGAIFYLPSLVNNENVQQSSVFSFLDSLKSSIFSIQKSDDTVEMTMTEESTEIPTIEAPEANADLDTEINTLETEAAPSEFIVQESRCEMPKGQYHIICGSFIEKVRAEALVDQLKEEGFTATLAGQSNSGTYRVSIQSFDNSEDAHRQINWIRNQGFDKAWILNKNF